VNVSLPASLPLSGIWEFRPDGQDLWETLEVPGCWEQLGLPHDWEGPGWYRRTVEIPQEWRSAYEARGLRLRFGAVSYACRVYLSRAGDSSMVEVGRHIGAWDAFSVEFYCAAAAADDPIEILVRVLKPGGETYPTRQTTAGFLPYVWGYLFGGIWQEVWLENTAEAPEPRRVSPFSVQGDRILREGVPFYPRMALSWGWYPETLHCNPPVDVMRSELEKLQTLGYNGVKCCLWVPPPAYLDLCDAMGMAVWMELPLWLPEMDAAQWRQVFEEVSTIVSQTRHHPCIALWTLGCELSASCPDAILHRLYRRVKELTGSSLVRDNSGGGECYGGHLQENADYYDYHFYCDLPFLRNTFDYFLPRWRPQQPWLFGEFCDADAFRDLIALKEAGGGALPWWALEDPQRNPQGARWDMNILGQWANMERHAMLARRDELKEGQRRQTLLHRKYTVELVRSYAEMSGYVITGLRDTPISIAGMFDDFGDFRYTPEEFTPFHADTVLFLGWHRRRNWVAGGDRPSYIDHWTHWTGETLLPRIGISHYGPAAALTSAVWELLLPDGTLFHSETLPDLEPTLEPGVVRQLSVFPLNTPPVESMTRLTLRVTVTLASGDTVHNTWPLWIAPRPDWKALPQWAAYDPEEKLRGLERHGAEWAACSQPSGMGDGDLLVASRWDPALPDFARAGGKAFVFVERGGGLPVVECPFWREAMKLFEPHSLWNHFPQEGFTDLQFYGLGPDCAFDPEALTARMPDAALHPLLRRVDARTISVTDYLLEAQFPGGGKLLLTTLRPHGGLGDQPDGLFRHVGGVQFLVAALNTLATAQTYGTEP